MKRVRVGVFAAGLCTFIDLYSIQVLLPTLAQQFGAGCPARPRAFRCRMDGIKPEAARVGSASAA